MNTLNKGLYTVAQNLPYGTHIFKIDIDNSNADNGLWQIDGVTVKTHNSGGGANAIYNWNPSRKDTFSFHQPKMPPIPEDAVVIADYMLMADHVVQVGSPSHISKGVRRVSGSRDVFYKDGSWAYHTNLTGQAYGSMVYSSGDCDASITAFGTKGILVAYNTPTRARQFEINDSSASSSTNGATNGSVQYPADSTLGTNKFGIDGNGTSSVDMTAWDIVSPIHTSSHYQTFETPYLHELVGGDRNMEQTNLVVTPDGKTWDEVTRDVSYIGGQRVTTTTDTATNGTTVVIFDEWRGVYNTDSHYFNKGFAIAYDRLICLENGNYIISWICYDNSSAGQHTYIYINGNYMVATYKAGQANSPMNGSYHASLKRGDYVQMKGAFGYDGINYNRFQITKVE
jgi:hypothetical protein